MNNTKTKQIIAGLPDDIFLRTANPTNQHLSSNDLKALAAAVPEWVPVKEREPEEMGWYLASLDTSDPNREFDVKECLYQSHGVWAYTNGYQVTAWMPKPQPYQERDKDDIEEKIRKVTERGDAITGDEFERERR